MPVTESFRDYVTDQLAPLGAVLAKRLFSGSGLYFDGKMFGLIHDDTVYLRVDDETRSAYEQRGLRPFRPVSRKPDMVSLNYYELPSEVLDDSDELLAWAQRAVRASRSETAARARARKARSDGAASQPKRAPAKPERAPAKPERTPAKPERARPKPARAPAKRKPAPAKPKRAPAKPVGLRAKPAR
jgi:DNA transformation protein and related proteins